MATAPTKRRISYFYDAEIGNYHYGQGHPMKVRLPLGGSVSLPRRVLAWVFISALSLPRSLALPFLDLHGIRRRRYLSKVRTTSIVLI